MTGATNISIIIEVSHHSHSPSHFSDLVKTVLAWSFIPKQEDIFFFSSSPGSTSSDLNKTYPSPFRWIQNIQEALNDSQNFLYCYLPSLDLKSLNFLLIDLKLFLKTYSQNPHHPTLALKYSPLKNLQSERIYEVGPNYEVFQQYTLPLENSFDGLISRNMAIFPKHYLEKFLDFFSKQCPSPSALFPFWEKEVFPALIREKKLIGVPMGTLLSSSPILRPCLFLDRDGIIIKDEGYVGEVERLKIYKNIIPLIQWANQKDWLVVVTTNQSGIARGMFSEERCQVLHKEIDRRLQRKGAKINAWYISPFHPAEGHPPFRMHSLLRKPGPGMFLLAQENFAIDIEKSWMVGDRESDIIQLPGLKTLLVQRQYSLEKVPSSLNVFKNLRGLLSFLQKKEN